MATPKTGKPKGRPSLSWIDDPDRYAIALAEGLMLSRGESERVAFDTAVALTSGQECESSKKPRGKRPPDWVKSAFRIPVMVSISGRSSTLRKKANGKVLTHEEANWRKSMTLAFALVFAGKDFDRCSEKIIELTCAIGEDEYGRNVLLPMLDARLRPI